MTFVATKIRRSVFGNMRIEIWSYVTSVATTEGDIATGIDNIEYVSWEQSTIRDTATIDHTTTGGTVAITGVTVGDTGTVMVIGRT